MQLKLISYKTKTANRRKERNNGCANIRRLTSSATCAVNTADYLCCCLMLATTMYALERFSVIKTVVVVFFFFPRISFGCCGRFTLAELLSFSLSVMLVLIWVLTGHWLLMDGASVCHGRINFSPASERYLFIYLFFTFRQDS